MAGLDFGTYVRVRSIFFGVSVVYAYMSTHHALGGVAGLLVPSSLLIRGAPVAPPTRSVFFSSGLQLFELRRSWLCGLIRQTGLPPVCPFVLVFVVFFLVLCRRGLSSLCGLVRRVARPRLRSSGFSVDSFFAVIAVFTQFLAFLVLRGFLSAKVTSHKSSTLSSHQMS